MAVNNKQSQSINTKSIDCPLNKTKVTEAINALKKFLSKENTEPEDKAILNSPVDKSENQNTEKEKSEDKIKIFNTNSLDKQPLESLVKPSDKIFLQINFCEILTKGRLCPYKKVTHLEPDSDVVIFVPKDASELNRRLTSDQDLSEEFPYNFNVIDIDALKSYYHTDRARRALSESADLFLADKKLYNVLLRYLGSSFSKRKSELKIGNTKLPTEATAENVRLALSFVSKEFPGGWGNISRAGLRTLKSPLLTVLRHDPPQRDSPNLEALDSARSSERIIDAAIREFVESDDFVGDGDAAEDAVVKKALERLEGDKEKGGFEGGKERGVKRVKEGSEGGGV